MHPLLAKIFDEESSRPEDRRCLRFECSSFYALNAVNTLPVHDLAAYDSGNLLAVATSIRERWPDKAIVIAGDDDHRLENNPILDKALAAAEAVAGVAIFPKFIAEQRAKGLTDFNDLAIQNPEVVSRQLDEVLQGVREQRLAATQSAELARTV